MYHIFLNINTNYKPQMNHLMFFQSLYAVIYL